MNVANVFMGWDPREERAYQVAAASLHRCSSMPINLQPIVLNRLQNQGILRRPMRRIQSGRSMHIQDGQVHRRIVTAAMRGQLYDLISSAPMATEFAISRFTVPLLQQTGWALFVDSDVLFQADIAELFACVSSDYAVMCVQHAQLTGEGTKMDGQLQVAYARKNWSSVMLFNCDHPANRKLTLGLINESPGRDLHRFCWLNDQEIGALPAEWNWLVNVQAMPPAPKLAHYTLGGPWLAGWRGAQYDELWLCAENDLGTGYRTGLCG